MGLFSKWFGKKPEAQGLVLADDDEDYFVDIDLPIVSVDAIDGGGIRVVARGEVDGQTVGLAVEFGASWEAKPLDDTGANFYWGGCTYCSIGEASDNFVALLAARYGTTVQGQLRMLSRVEAQMVGLNSDPTQMLESPMHGKAFFHADTDTDDTPDDARRYAEVFTNVDVAAGRFEFHEKDPEYRLALLRALTE